MLFLLDCPPHTNLIGFSPASAINAAARMIYGTSRYDHVTSLLSAEGASLAASAWENRVQALCIRVQVPERQWAGLYLADSLQRVTDVQSRRHLWSSSSSTLVVRVRHWLTVLFQLRPPEHGTTYRTLSRLRLTSHRWSFAAALKTSALTFILTTDNTRHINCINVFLKRCALAPRSSCRVVMMNPCEYSHKHIAHTYYISRNWPTFWRW